MEMLCQPSTHKQQWCCQVRQARQEVALYTVRPLVQLNLHCLHTVWHQQSRVSERSLTQPSWKMLRVEAGTFCQ